jgi:pimeloyl-ACP methyl ester carboxylesterase
MQNENPSVPALQLTKLHQFRCEMQPRRIELDGVTWEYILTGKGPVTILILPGIVGTAESAWQLISHLSKRFRILAPSYPALNTIKAVAMGLAEILQREGVEKSVVFGGSYGGFVAQVFVRCYPDEVEKLLLSHTTPPNPLRGKVVKTVSSLVDWMPMPVLRSLFRLSLTGLMRTPDRSLRRAVRAYFYELAREHVDRQHIASTYRRMADYDTCWALTPGDLQEWPGKILLLLSEDDPLTPPRVRAALQALYPQAGLQLFSGSGHLSSILKQDEFFHVIDRFIDEN